MVADDADHVVPARWEWTAVALLLAAYLAVNLLTATISPIVWSDETLFADPAWRLATGRGFTSTFWPQPRGSFLAMNVPLYFVVLSGWIKLFGLSPLTVRSLNMLLVALAAGILWRTTRAGGLIRSPRWAVFLLVVLLCSLEITTISRNGRYDALCALGCSIGFMAALSSSPFLRIAVAILVGMMLPLAGLQVTFYIAAMGAVLVGFWPRRMAAFMPWMGAGGALGLSVLVLVLWRHGALGRFVSVLRKVKILHAPPFTPRVAVDFAIAHPTLMIGVVVLLVLVIENCRRSRFRWRAPEVFGLAAAIAVPAVLMIFYHFRGEYGWMISGPILVSAIMAIERLDDQPSSRRAVRLAVIGLIAVALVGFPLVISGALLRAEGRNYARVEAFVAENVRASDRVAIDAAAFYPARIHAADLIGRYHLPAMTQTEKSAVTVLIIDPANRPVFDRYLGGTWQQVDSLPPIEPRHLSWLRFPGNKMVYDLAAYRRAPVTPAERLPSSPDSGTRDK
ncbi:MAG TPA: hypothetical protein VL282_15000 [Tepidisphaeraceae bacterium]|jgi:hypothetical protein|nr:hypothetical protein [Tepidisphaeraceae bacterium]